MSNIKLIKERCYVKRKCCISKKDLEDLYINQHMTCKEIGDIYGCSRQTIENRLKEYNISRRTVNDWISEWNKQTKKKYNKYDLSGEYGIGWTYNTGQEFYFDLEDFHLIKDICWMENNEGYIVGTCQSYSKPKIVKMHNVITNYPYVDHICHKKYDNRRSQLRRANDLLNARNRTIPSNNISGVKGVCWRKKSQKWRAYITINHKQIELGEFVNKEDAIEAREKAEKEYFGEWRYQTGLLSDGKTAESVKLIGEVIE